MTDGRTGATDRPISVGVDVGGTFTDVTLIDRSGALTSAKVPTTEDQSEGVLAGIRKACGAADVAPGDIEQFRHATTAAVNALLEESGATTALVTTEGFGDVLEIRRQDRPALYDLSARPPDPLAPRQRRYELDERATPEGIETPVDAEDVRALADEIRDEAPTRSSDGSGGVDSVAVCLLHAYAHPDNERRVAEILREELAVPVSASHEVLAEFREYERTATTVIDAYVRPVVEEYLARLVERAAAADVPAPRVMQSNGGIADAETVRERAATTVLSGPAAGVVGAGGVAERSATADAAADAAGVVTFDMGGTSSDVSLLRGGEVARTTDAEVGGRPIGLPVVDVTTVGAGGGSIAWVDAGGALRVGPESAGADPGPACYGGGGTDPTVTDAAVVLGYVGASTALGGELSLDVDAAHDVLSALADEAGLDDTAAAARGVYEVATARMARAIRSATVERGYDPREFALVAFGGAGPMHAAALAGRLGIETVLVPRACGVLSAYGLLTADEAHDAVRTRRTPLADADAAAVESTFDDLRAEVLAETSDSEAARIERTADFRYAGQSFTVEAEVGDPVELEALAERFHERHERTRGYRMDEPVELVNLRARAVVPGEDPPVAYDPSGDPLAGEREATFDSGVESTPVYERGALAVGRALSGPTIVEQAESTTVVPPGWTATVQADGTLALTGGDDD
jgi:N-methylhydantoinase A